jgi:anti-sigma-K factor RskA
VTTSPHLGAAAVAFEAVPAPPSGHAYQLWLAPLGGAPRSAAVLAQVPSIGAPVVTRFEPADVLVMTVEPAGGSPQPTGTVLMSVGLV